MGESQWDGRSGGLSPMGRSKFDIMSNNRAQKTVRYERSWKLHPFCPQFLEEGPASKLSFIICPLKVQRSSRVSQSQMAQTCNAAICSDGQCAMMQLSEAPQRDFPVASRVLLSSPQALAIGHLGHLGLFTYFSSPFWNLWNLWIYGIYGMYGMYGIYIHM